jgi:hypothetical protein
MDRRSFLTAAQPGVEQTNSPAMMRSMASGLQPYNGVWTKAEVIHLLKRTMFGASQKDISYFLSKGASASVDELLNPLAPMPAPPLKN